MKIRDGDWELMSWDPVTHKSTWKMEKDGYTTIRSDQPVDSTIDSNAAVRNATAGNKMGDWVKIASLPPGVVWDEKLNLVEAFNQHDDKYISKFLNNSENRAWRTFEGDF